MKTGRFYGVGLGPGDPGLVTLRALEVLRSVQVIYTAASRQSGRSVSGAVIEALPGVSARREELSFTMATDFPVRLARIDEHAERIAAELRMGNDCAFTTIGDPMTYSTCGYLLRALRRVLPELECEIVAGVNSWSALAAASASPLVEDNGVLRIVPSYLRPDSPELHRMLETEGAVVLLKTYRSRNEYLDSLAGEEYDLLYGANIGLENEFISSDPEAIRERPDEYLSMLMIRKGARR
ncbi:MAG: precorrin-2 C(20)-methyltransferase [Victivallales bacterium]|jgi:precorrin-2 C(20)-methyltransferase